MTRRRGLAAVTLVAGALLAGGNLAATCGPPPPSSDTCSVAPGAPMPSVTAIEIGSVDGDGVFHPFTADQVVPLQIGGQGASMIVARLRVTGANIDKCLGQSTRLETPSGELLASEESPLRVTAQGNGVWITGSALLPYYDAPGKLARMRAVAAGVTVQVDVWVDYMGMPDAALPTDAALPADAGRDGP